MEKLKYPYVRYYWVLCEGEVGDVAECGGELRERKCCHIEFESGGREHGLTYCPGEPTVPGGGKSCIMWERWTKIKTMRKVDCNDPSVTHTNCQWAEEQFREYYRHIRTGDWWVKWYVRETHCPSGKRRTKSVGSGGGGVNPPVE